MGNIYIIFSRTNTKLGWMIRKTLRYDYNHVSVCINNNMYSFGRKYYQLPFVGGFTEENLYRVMYPKDTLKIRVFKIPVTNNQSVKLNKVMEDFSDVNNQYLYNLLTPINIFLKKETEIYRVHTCVTFILYLLKNVGINIDKKEYCESSVTLKDLNEILKDYWCKDSIIYKNDLKDIDIHNTENTYLKSFSHYQRINKTVNFIINLNKRLYM